MLVDEADYCFSSMMFTSAVAAITAMLILSGLSITLLCARVRRDRKGGKESAADMVHTLRFGLLSYSSKCSSIAISDQ